MNELKALLSLDLAKFFNLSKNWLALALGGLTWFVLRCIASGFYSVDQNERVVLTSFGRAQRLGSRTTLDDPALADLLIDKEKERYVYPLVRVIMPGGPYFKWPWQTIHRVSMAIQTENMAHDPEDPNANNGGQMLEAVTKDQLNIGLKGQIRWRVSDQNLYAWLFGVKNPIAYVMGFFVAVLRERIATFQAESSQTFGGVPVSVNDLRMRLADINDHMVKECGCSAARYGVDFDASLVTVIVPPDEVETALAAINTAHNQVASDVSLAQARADEKIEASKRAVEISSNFAMAEVEPIRRLAKQLAELKSSGKGVLDAYLQKARISFLERAREVVVEEEVRHAA